MDENQNTGGRPTLYRGEYCQMLIDHMADGLSFESFAGVIGVHRDTLYAWVKEYPEFSDAKKTGLEFNLLFWENQGIKGLWGSKDSSFNSTVWIFNMKNRHKWRDKQPDEADVVVNNVTAISEDQLDARIAELSKKLTGEK